MDMNFTLENVASLHNFTTWEPFMEEEWHAFAFKGSAEVAERLGIMKLMTVTDGRFTVRMTERIRAYDRSKGIPLLLRWDFLFEDEADAIAFRMWLDGAKK